ncbi:hypothetical protein ABMX92_21560 [Vibrio vulnificus]|uniref:hypothetical protein n=1 Tax=Vibrio vulnificus TaxID=672 RepID=UPI004057DF72
MFAIKSPSNYNEMLAKLNKSTFFTTLFFMVAMRIFDYVPLVLVPKELVPPIAGAKDITSWAISFGVIPLLSAWFAYLLSHSFEIHNKAAKLLQIRYAWKRFYIVKPMAEIAGSPIGLNKESVNKVMHELYYPEVKKIDSHYVNLFWRYAQTFWVMFEHLLVVISFMIIMLLWGSEQSLKWLVYYFLIVLTATLVQFLFVTAPKSTDQVKQIPQGTISRYFRTEFSN